MINSRSHGLWKILAVGAALLICGPAQAGADKHIGYSETRQVLMELVVAGQTSLVHYRAFEVQARNENLPYIADFFKAMATSQTVMVRNFGNILRELGGNVSICAIQASKRFNTRRNLITAIKNEIRETDKLYPEALARITREEHAAGMITLKHAVHAQQIHRNNMQEIYEAAISFYSLLKNEFEHRRTTYYVCQLTGAVLLNDLPTICPVRATSTSSYQELKTIAIWEGLSACQSNEYQRRL